MVSWTILGNGSQQGTPTPSAPIQPEFVGVRTANLYDNNSPSIVRCYYSSDTNMFTLNQNNAFVTVGLEAGKRYFVKGAKRYSASTTVRWCTSSSAPANGVSVVRTGTFLQSDIFVLDANTTEKYLSIFLCGDSDYNAYGSVTNAIAANGADLVVDNGYKIPLTCGGETTPVYLGQTQTIRNVYKYQITGQETITKYTSYGAQNCFFVSTDKECHADTIPTLADRYITTDTLRSFIDTDNCVQIVGWVCRIHDGRFNDVDGAGGIREYLQQQYQNGTPVTVWYVLATPETGIVNEPLCKIGTYADELSSTNAEVTIPTTEGQNTLTVDTDLQPSEMTITYIKEGQ